MLQIIWSVVPVSIIEVGFGSVELCVLWVERQSDILDIDGEWLGMEDTFWTWSVDRIAVDDPVALSNASNLWY